MRKNSQLVENQFKSFFLDVVLIFQDYIKKTRSSVKIWLFLPQKKVPPLVFWSLSVLLAGGGG